MKALWINVTLVFLSACFTGASDKAAKPSAEELYREALENLDDGLYPEAIAGFTDVRSKYPYSSQAPLAELAIGDAHFKRGKHDEAVDAYRSFLKFYPKHDKAAYALLQIAESYYAQMPQDWFILPPGHEKDQSDTRLAISAYQDVVQRFPSGDEAKRAKERLTLCRLGLAQHELYVANFYFEQGHFKATIQRLLGLMDKYPDVGLDAAVKTLLDAAKHEVTSMKKLH